MFKKFVFTAFAFFCINIAFAQLKMPAIFSNYMVLQRDAQIAVWGTASPNSEVEVQLTCEAVSGLTAGNIPGHSAGEQGGGLNHSVIKGTLAKQCCKADAKGNWRLHLPPVRAIDNCQLEIKNGNNNIIFTEVAVGDVWLASGQSNMDFPLRNSDGAKNELSSAPKNNKIRFFSVKNTLSTTPQKDVNGGPWMKCDSNSMKNFSAVAYYFGKEIEKNQHVTVGLIKDSWSGTACEAWASQKMLRTLPAMKQKIDAFNQSGITDEIITQRTNATNINWTLASSAFEGLKIGVHQLEFNDSDWQSMIVPMSIESTSLGSFDGIIWFRQMVQLDSSFTSKDLVLSLGQLDLAAHVYFNGELIGTTDMDFDQYRSFNVPAKLVRLGKNILVIRLIDMWGKGGILGPTDSLFISKRDEKGKVSLAGTWRYHAGLEQKFVKDDYFNKIPGLIFNAKIAPLIPFTLKGFIWYQGEGNASKAQEYRILFPLMIKDWRDMWMQGDLPFLFVQLPGYSSNQYQSKYDWAFLREAQLKTLSHANTGMAVTIDLVKENNLHPHNKKEVGERLALVARKVAYHQDIQSSGPIYKNMKV